MTARTTSYTPRNKREYAIALIADSAMDEARKIVEAEERARAVVVKWTPQDGPQRAAYYSKADVIGYGGAAGGGKSALIVGKAATQHRRSIIFRRVFPSLTGIIDYSKEVYKHEGSEYNIASHVWELANGAMVRFASIPSEKEKDKFQGQPHDFIAFDEATEFPESMVRFITAWNRSTDPLVEQCQTLLTFNPPLDDSGSWVIRYFAPWLEEEHPNPARDGELRYFASIDGKEIECASGDQFVHNGEMITPRSRTFFHASLKDNPILERTGYGAQIDSMPEPLRSALKGNFKAARVPDPFQIIKPEWVRAAQARWAERYGNDNGPQTALGVDVSHGGDDETVIAPSYGDFVAELMCYPGVSVTTGFIAAGLVTAALRDDATIGVDLIGYGSGCYDTLCKTVKNVIGINFGAGSNATDKSRKMKMLNVRAAAYWALREELDPENGATLCLPPDQQLLADLCAPRWELTVNGRIKVEEKAEIKARLGRSPDRADGVVLSRYANRLSIKQIVQAGTVRTARQWVDGGTIRVNDDDEQPQSKWRV